jgi:hypothetical protein
MAFKQGMAHSGYSVLETYAWQGTWQQQPTPCDDMLQPWQGRNLGYTVTPAM